MMSAIYIGPTTVVTFHCDGAVSWRERAQLRQGTKGHYVKSVLVGDKVCFCPAQSRSYALILAEQCMSLELDLATLTIA